MFNVGDKVITETADSLSGLTGIVTVLNKHHEAAHVLLDDSVELDGSSVRLFFFFNTELRKVESA